MGRPLLISVWRWSRVRKAWSGGRRLLGGGVGIWTGVCYSKEGVGLGGHSRPGYQIEQKLPEMSRVLLRSWEASLPPAEDFWLGKGMKTGGWCRWERCSEANHEAGWCGT